VTVEGQHRPQLTATRARTGARARWGRPLTPDEAAALASAAGIETWARIAQRLVDDVRQSRSAAPP
jgi:hypothetical protein